VVKGGKLTVADFFCGAGGFSEGFRQAGFRVAFALDNWKPAIETHTLNHPDTKHALMSILDLDTEEKIEAVVPDTNVIIGSPPCVSFSGSNKAGKADKSLGIKLIEAYLRIVAVKMHKKGSCLKYWAMENVPNSSKYIKEKYTFSDLGLSGGSKVALEIPTRNFFNAAQYGVPQARMRFIAGNYPIPTPKYVNPSTWVTLGNITRKLGAPWERKERVQDPNYDFGIPATKLTDHNYDTTVEEFEWERARRLKVDHGYMGRMSFPEALNRPSRTVMATRSASTREAIILDGENGTYRLPTIREVATFMSFPITYQFQGNSEETKYKLVGNAVCCKLARSIASEIMQKEGIRVNQRFLHGPDVRSTLDLTGRARVERKSTGRHPLAKFARHVPELKVGGTRVELVNRLPGEKKERIKWRVIVHTGTGTRARYRMVKSTDFEKKLAAFNNYGRLVARVERIQKHVDVREFQQLHISRKRSSGALNPDKLLDEVKRVVDASFPEQKFAETMVDVKQQIYGRGQLPVRIVAAAHALRAALN